MKKITTFLWLSVLTAMPLGVHAAHINLGLSSTSVEVGDSLFVEAMITELELSAAPSVGVYDIKVSWDPSVFSFDAGSVGFGSGLSVFELSAQDVDDSMAASGMVSIFEVSLDSPADLNDEQPGDFTLFDFSVTAMGASVGEVFSVEILDLGDADGNLLASSISNSELVSVAGATPVPVPASIWLLMSSGMAFIGFRRRRDVGLVGQEKRDNKALDHQAAA